MTLVHMFQSAGFYDVKAAYSGGWFAEEYFEQLPENKRPLNINDVDSILKPIIKVVTKMQAPLGDEEVNCNLHFRAVK